MPARSFRLVVAGAVAAATTVFAVTPMAGAALGDGLLGQVGTEVEGAAGGLLGAGAGSGGSDGGTTAAPAPTASPQPTAGLPPAYVPPAHGTNPHGQGTVGVVDLTPEDAEPLPYDPGGGSEDVVLGRARGEQDGDEYHGHITIVSLLGNEIVGVDTSEGETESGPLAPLQENLLDALCDGSGDQICLTVLAADSATDSRGSHNRFEAAGAELGGEEGITAEVASSEGNIREANGCQTATGESQVANASVGGALVVDIANSRSESRACNDGSRSQQNSGMALIAINGEVVPLPPGCETGEENTTFDIALVSVVCNADDSSRTGGDQNSAPYGVREAASVFLLPILGEVTKLTTAASESHAVAPGDDGPNCPDPNDPRCPGGGNQGDECPDPDNPDCPDAGLKGGDDAGAGPGAGAGGPGDDGPSGDARGELAFTGADLSVLGLIGLAVMGAGLGGMALADRRRRSLA